MSQMSSEPNDAASESAPPQPNTVQIPLRLIEVGNRLRKLKAAQVIHIKESLAQRGQLQPIIVTPAEDGRYALLAGNYRRAAAELLG
jgi:ParB family transcriptional regulator, chromosome partitioning protein